VSHPDIYSQRSGFSTHPYQSSSDVYTSRALFDSRISVYRSRRHCTLDLLDREYDPIASACQILYSLPSSSLESHFRHVGGSSHATPNHFTVYICQYRGGLGTSSLESAIFTAVSLTSTQRKHSSILARSLIVGCLMFRLWLEV
jgi:hypothetical protein